MRWNITNSWWEQWRVKVWLCSAGLLFVLFQAPLYGGDNGLGTTQDVLQAEQELAQADYDLEAAQGALDDAQVTLVDALGVFPTAEIHVADIPLNVNLLLVGYREPLRNVHKHRIHPNPPVHNDNDIAG